MAGKVKKNQRAWLVLLIVACLGAILIGGIYYVTALRGGLADQAVQNVLTVTLQQQQAFDNFISQDQERLHSFAEFFSRNEHGGAEEVCRQLTIFDEVDAIYSVICLDEGWFCSNASDKIRQLDEENLAFYNSLSGSGVRDTYIGLFTGDPKFGYYETFNFANGHRGLIQKSYNRTKVSETFSLSFYNDQGFAYVVNGDGDILLRSAGMIGDHLYDNILDVLTGTHGKQEDADILTAALATDQVGSHVFTGNMGSFVYTYVPVENVEEWFLVSIVPMSAITEEADEILLDSQVALLLLTAILAVCAVFMMLIWRTNKDLAEKDRAIEYRERLFDILSTHLSSNTDDVYMMVDALDGKAEYVSPNVERVLGISEQSITASLSALGTPLQSSGDPVDYQTLREMTPGEALESIQTERVNPKTGEHKWFQERLYCTLMQDRRKIIVYISDRTEDLQTRNTLTEALQMAQVANEAKSSFLSSVSHDIRTPMNAIIGFVSLLKADAGDPELVLEYTQRIDAASQHLLGLINDVLDMNKIESGNTTLNIANVDLADIIDEINTIIRPQAKAKDQTFDITVSSLVYEHLMGDKLRLNQILINLLSNAVKYTQEGGRIEFRIEELPQVVKDYSRVRFIVSDNGLGMSEEYLKVIFDPFTREDSASTRQIQGTGLGMAITKSLVDLMGGTIRVDSALDKGSTFTVELELRIQEREDVDPKFWAEHHVGRMIVADDDEDACRNVVRAMRDTGVMTDYSTDGATAIQMMREAREAGRPYDLILLDWKMPNLDGLETARLIRKNYPEKIPILLVTAYDWGDIEQEAIEIGVSHFMPKPFFMSTFKDAIRRVMGRTAQQVVEKTSIVKGKQILVVDDIEVNQIILVKILTSLGAACDVAGNGQLAAEKFESAPPGTYDLILMDVQMPVMDGYEATRTIRAGSHPEARTIPIIAMTANAFVDDVRDAISSGMDAHVAKPVQVDKLEAAIRQVLQSRKEKELTAGQERS
ncbi:MAG: response regulator [Clostridiales bacterium]|nr:response regulator [Clostridiales bacterium]